MLPSTLISYSFFFLFLFGFSSGITSKIFSSKNDFSYLFFPDKYSAISFVHRNVSPAYNSPYLSFSALALTNSSNSLNFPKVKNSFTFTLTFRFGFVICFLIINYFYPSVITNISNKQIAKFLLIN